MKPGSRGAAAAASEAPLRLPGAWRNALRLRGDPGSISHVCAHHRPKRGAQERNEGLSILKFTEKARSGQIHRINTDTTRVLPLRASRVGALDQF